MSARFLPLLAILAAAMPDAGRSATARDFSLRNLEIKCVSSEWGAPKWDRSIDGNPLKVAGTEYPRGLGTHANSRLVVKLFGEAKRFRAKVGLDDEMLESSGSIEFVVSGDGKRLWRSGVMRPGERAKSVDVSLRGEIHNRVNSVLAQSRIDERGVGNIASHESVMLVTSYVAQVVKVPRIRQLVEVDDANPLARTKQMTHEIRTDETRTTRHQYVHNQPP